MYSRVNNSTIHASPAELLLSYADASHSWSTLTESSGGRTRSTEPPWRLRYPPIRSLVHELFFIGVSPFNIFHLDSSRLKNPIQLKNKKVKAKRRDRDYIKLSTDAFGEEHDHVEVDCAASYAVVTVVLAFHKVISLVRYPTYFMALIVYTARLVSYAWRISLFHFVYQTAMHLLALVGWADVLLAEILALVRLLRERLTRSWALTIYYLSPTLLFSASLVDWARHQAVCPRPVLQAFSALVTLLSQLTLPFVMGDYTFAPHVLDVLAAICPAPIYIISICLVQPARILTKHVVSATRASKIALRSAVQQVILHRQLIFWVAIWTQLSIVCATPEDTKDKPMFDGTRTGYILWRIGLAGWLAWKSPKVAIHAARPNDAPPGPHDPDYDDWQENNIKLYGAIITCVPDWLKTTLFVRNANDGLGALIHLEREYGSHDPNDRAAAVSRVLSRTFHGHVSEGSVG